MLKTLKQDEWDLFLATHDTNDYSIFKLNRNLLKKTPATHPLIGSNGTVYSDIEKIKLLADMFQQQFTPNLGLEISAVNASTFIVREAPFYNYYY